MIYVGGLSRRYRNNEQSQPEIAERFSVALSTVEKLWHRFHATGSYEALPHSGGRHSSVGSR
ncbi:MAG: hypothetical protein ABI891_07985 [Acidobacteriota bacterium]